MYDIFFLANLMSYKKDHVHFSSRINSLAIEAETQCLHVVIARPANYFNRKFEISGYPLKIAKKCIGPFL